MLNLPSSSGRWFEIALARECSPAFFSSGTRPWRALILFLLLAGAMLVAPAMRGELLVANANWGGSGMPIVLRFNPETGARVGWLGYESESYEAMTLLSPDEICVSSNILGTYELYRFNRRGDFLGVSGMAELGMFSGMLRGPDGNLYTIMQAGGWASPPGPWRIVRFDQPTPTTFIAEGTGGMSRPVDMAIGPAGRLYVADETLGILRFDATTGAFLDLLIPNGTGGLTATTRMTFGPDGRLYLSSGSDNAVFRFNATTGQFVDRFIAPGSGGLGQAGDLAFGPDGHLYVVSRAGRQVLRFNGGTGAFMNVAAADPDLRTPGDIVFTQGSATDAVWYDDDLPAGATASSSWSWLTANPTPFAGTRAHGGANGAGLQSHSFNFAGARMSVGAGESLFAYVYLENHSQESSEIMVSWCDGQGWEHRAYWGRDLINYGQNGTASRRYMGRLPRSGWARLEIPAGTIGLEGASVQGMSFAAYNARATWDRIGKSVASTTPPPTTPDTTPPFVSIAEPAEGATVSRMMNFVATGGDNVGVTRVEFYLDGSDRTVLVDSPPAPWSAAWDTRAFSNGTHNLMVVVRDAAGLSASVSRTINIQNTDDVTRPDIAITAPSNGATIAGEVLLQATASDNVRVEQVEFEINGALIGADNTAPYSLTWNSRSLPDGNYTLIARAFDAASNMSAATAALTVNNAAPPPPSGGTEVVWVEDALPAGAWGTGSGGDGWNWVTRAFSGSRAHESSNSGGLHSHSFSDPGQPFAIQTGDQLMVYIYLDPANTPRAAMLSWRDGTNWEHRAYWGADIIPYGTPNTPSRFRAGNLPAAGGWARLTVSAAAVGLEGRQISGMSFILSDGRATWDRAGKLVGETPPPPSDDTSPPTASVFQPAAGATVSGSVWMRARAVDNRMVTSLQMRVDGTTIWTTTASGPGVDYGQAWDSTTVANGSHVVTAVAVDSAGNQATSAPVTINVNNTSASTVTLWMEGAAPTGASLSANGGDAWTWVTDPSPASPSGLRVHQSANATGYHAHSFNFAWYPLEIATGDSIFVYVLIDATRPPREIILSWCDGSNWEHRAYWGENLMNFGTNNTASRRYMGPIPSASGWVQLQIPASQVGLEGRSIQGMTFGLVDGQALWDTMGKVGP